MPWTVDREREAGVLHLCLDGALTDEEMLAFRDAHNATIDAFRSRDYKVWCDVSTLKPFTARGAQLMEECKAYSASRPNFRGSAVKVASATVAMQHRRTSIETGVMSTELISSDETALRDHLRKVYRK